MSDAVFTPLVPPRLSPAAPDVREASDRARARGYADGYGEGRRRAQDELARLTREADERLAREQARSRDEVQAVLTALRAARDDVDASAAALAGTDLRRIEAAAVELAETILGVELSDAARSAAHALRRAAGEAPVASWLRVELNERDLGILRESGADPANATVEVVASAEVAPGGAIVRVEHAQIDTRVEAALARAREAVRDDDTGQGRP